MRLEIDKPYKLSIENTDITHNGVMRSGLIDGHFVAWWDGNNPILISQQLLEGMGSDDSEIEALPNRAYRVCQYRIEFVKAYPQNGFVTFNVIPLPENEVLPEYWQRFKSWCEYQGLI